MKNKSRILITGSSGMIGGELSTYLAAKGHDVIGVDNLSEGRLENSKDCHKFYQTDICDLRLLDQIFKIEKPNYVIHAAAEAAEVLSSFIRSFTYENNVVGSANVINCCVNHDVEKILFFSSVARWAGSDLEPPFYEEDKPAPLDCYGFSKILTEWDLKEAHQHFGLKYNVLNCFNVTSPYQNFYSQYRNAIAIFIRQVVNRENITVYGPGNAIRSFSDVQYICPPIEKLLFDDGFVGESFNLGSMQPITVLQAANLVIEEGRKRNYTQSKVVHLEPRIEAKVAYCDTVKAQEMLGLNDQTDLPNLISRMFDACLAQPKREIKKRDYEITKNMYSFWK